MIKFGKDPIIIIQDELGADVSAYRPLGDRLYLSGIEIATLLACGVLSTFCIALIKGFGAEIGKKLGGYAADQLLQRLSAMRKGTHELSTESADELRKQTEVWHTEIREILQELPNLPVGLESRESEALRRTATAEVEAYLLTSGFPQIIAQKHAERIVLRILEISAQP